ncbi:hypothetical protein [Mucilaginibacter auburnensis]|uniref:Uncharacterized protein n=1 Tax=Mucilaginibacter auburnensis TaxID=1457233 RepID=A0A2H9VS03_9SPHI|nr:hypothetical protein [Mucilaginibacter auburnensis]PJJ83594.1 hypothetical protein CLV57_0579 [Mucilaginibacter auburnensis]
MNTLIRNRSDLRAEIFRLQQDRLEKQIQLKQHFSSPTAIMSTVAGLLGGGSSDKDEHGKPKQDFVGFLSRFIIPLVLNKTLFKGSGFIMKALVGLASQKASNYVSSDSISNIWDKAKGLVGGLLSKKSPKPASVSYKKISKTE